MLTYEKTGDALKGAKSITQTERTPDSRHKVQADAEPRGVS